MQRLCLQVAFSVCSSFGSDFVNSEGRIPYWWDGVSVLLLLSVVCHYIDYIGRVLTCLYHSFFISKVRIIIVSLLSVCCQISAPYVAFAIIIINTSITSLVVGCLLMIVSYLGLWLSF